LPLFVVLLVPAATILSLQVCFNLTPVQSALSPACWA